MSTTCKIIKVVPSIVSTTCKITKVVPSIVSTTCKIIKVVPSIVSTICKITKVVPSKVSTICKITKVVPSKVSTICKITKVVTVVQTDWNIYGSVNLLRLLSRKHCDKVNTIQIYGINGRWYRPQGKIWILSTIIT